MAAQEDASCASRLEDSRQRIDVNFEYEATKFMFLQKFTQYFFHNANIYRALPHTRTGIEKYIQDIKQGLSKSDTCEVIQENGKDVLITKKKSPDEPIFQIVSVEDCFDILLKAHRETGHGGRVKMAAAIDPKYKIPRACINYFSRLCKVCSESTRKAESTAETHETSQKPRPKTLPKPRFKASPKLIAFNNAVQINVIKMFVPDAKFKFVLVYFDTITSFILIRPLVDRNMTEVAIEMLKIFADFGTPSEIKVYDNDKQFLRQTLKQNLSPVWPTDHISVGGLTKTEYAGTRSYQNRILALIRDWMNTTGSTNWAIACHMIQWQINNSPVRGGFTPYVALFRGEPNYVTHYKPSVMTKSVFSKLLPSGPSPSGHNPLDSEDTSLIKLSDEFSADADVCELPAELQNIAPESLVVEMDESDDDDPQDDSPTLPYDDTNDQKSIEISIQDDIDVQEGNKTYEVPIL